MDWCLTLHWYSQNALYITFYARGRTFEFYHHCHHLIERYYWSYCSWCLSIALLISDGIGPHKKPCFEVNAPSGSKTQYIMIWHDSTCIETDSDNKNLVVIVQMAWSPNQAKVCAAKKWHWQNNWERKRERKRRRWMMHQCSPKAMLCVCSPAEIPVVDFIVRWMCFFFSAYAAALSSMRVLFTNRIMGTWCNTTCSCLPVCMRVYVVSSNSGTGPG